MIQENFPQHIDRQPTTTTTYIINTYEGFSQELLEFYKMYFNISLGILLLLIINLLFSYFQNIFLMDRLENLIYSQKSDDDDDQDEDDDENILDMDDMYSEEEVKTEPMDKI